MIKSVLTSIALLFSSLSIASPVNINTADADQIAKALKGIGPGKAAAIVEFRAENGPFQRINDLASVKGIGKKTLENNKDDIVIVVDK